VRRVLICFFCLLFPWRFAFSKDRIEILSENAKRGDASAFSEIKDKAQTGDSYARYVLVCLLDNRDSIFRDDSQAAYWLSAAALDGEFWAAFRLSQTLSSHVGPNKDDVEAYKWFLVGVAEIKPLPQKWQSMSSWIASEEMKLKTLLTAEQIKDAEDRAKICVSKIKVR
jgi:hypothetical protein